MSDVANKSQRRTLRLAAYGTSAGLLVSFGMDLDGCDNAHVIFLCEAE